jgi:hypothetical protein
VRVKQSPAVNAVITSPSLINLLNYNDQDLHTSLLYCRGGKRMIAFAVLVDRTGVTAFEETSATGRPWQAVGGKAGPVNPGVFEAAPAPNVGGPGTQGCAVIHVAEHQLPLFVISFETQTSAAAIQKKKQAAKKPAALILKKVRPKKCVITLFSESN